MPIGANMFYSDPNIGRIAGNLATAIYGDPEARAKRGLYDAQIENYGAEAAKNRAEAGKHDAETRGLGITNNARTNLGRALAGFSAPIAGETPQQTMDRNAPAVAEFMQAFPGSAEQGAAALKTHLSSIFGLGGNDDMARSLVLDGKMPDQNFSPTTQRADEVAGRNSDLRTGEELAVHGLDNRASMGRAIYTEGQQNNRNASDEAGRNRRFYDTPINAPANSTVFLPPTNPNAQTMGPRLYGRTDTNAQNRVPPEVSGANLDDVVLTAAQMVGGTKDVGGKPDLADGFLAALSKDPAKLAQARIVAADTLQKTRNVAQAAQAFMQAMGLQQGSTLQNVSNGNPFTSDMQIVPPVGATPAASQQAAPQPAPPPQQRQPGQVYQTPRGPMTWTGTGWR